MSLLAITREVSPEIGQCELTHLSREPIDALRARQEHGAYEATLRGLGCTVQQLPAPPGMPDAVFVEDVAVVLDELAIITRPGAASRRPESASVAEVLAEHRELEHLTAPATLDGGDVLVAGRTVFVGVSSRTNREGIDQLAAIVNRRGYRVVPVQVSGILHLKSAVGLVAPDTLLLNRRCVAANLFGAMRMIDVDPTEPSAACALAVGDAVVFADIYPRTRARLEAAGHRVAAVPLTELAKAEAGVTCCSLIVPG